MVKVAVLGYGTVGSGVVEVIESNNEQVSRNAGEEMHVKYILDLRDFPEDPYGDRVVHDVNLILEDPEVSVVCEVMGGTGPAYQFTKQALEAGKSVCTSNKELVAKHGPELLAIARTHNCSYLFEASVGGGIPIIRPLNVALTAERIELVRACRYVDEAVEIPLNYGGTRDAHRLHHFDCQFSGSDYIDNPDWLAEKEYLEKHGAEMVFFPYTEGTSSSRLKELIASKLL